MARLRRWALRWVPLLRRRASAATLIIVRGVATWWLLIVGVVALTAPAPERLGRTPRFTFAPGASAHIYAPPLQAWPIPIDRATHDDYQRAVLEDDEGTLTDVVARPGWIPVADNQLVRVV